MEIMFMRRLVCMLGIMLTIAVGTTIALTVKKRGDRGFLAFYYPLIPGFIAVIIELLLIETRAHSYTRAALVDYARATRMLMGPAWLTFCHAHYKLIMRGKGLPLYRVGMALSGFSFLLFLLARLLPNLHVAQDRLSSLMLSVTLFYAGIMAFAILRTTRRLVLSSWAGIVCAGLSMVYYPFIALSEAFGLSFRNFSSDYPLSLQVFPFYLTCICLVIMVYLRMTDGKDDNSGTVAVIQEANTRFIPPPNLLTPRETDVFLLLVSGYDAAAIAKRLYVSISTIKTHSSSIYKKLKVKTRHELIAHYHDETTERSLGPES